MLREKAGIDKMYMGGLYTITFIKAAAEHSRRNRMFYAGLGVLECSTKALYATIQSLKC